VKCQHEGCDARGVECRHPDDNAGPEYFCGKHAQDAGYCYGCGGFCAGIGSFEVSISGLCDECDAEAKADHDGDGTLDPDFDYPTYEDW
jgi:hypothetical protein